MARIAYPTTTAPGPGEVAPLPPAQDRRPFRPEALA